MEIERLNEENRGKIKFLSKAMTEASESND
jgi:hypothetical protein